MFPNSKNVHGVAIVAILAWCVAASTATARNWNVVDGNWSLGTNWSPSGTPASGEATNIVFTDGVARTVTYDFASPNLGLLSIDLTGAGTTTNTLSMPNNLSLTASALLVGGYNGSTQTTGRGAVTQSNGSMTIAALGDLVVGYGAGSTGTYTLSGISPTVFGQITANQDEVIGFNGTGTFTQLAGTNTINSSGVGILVLGDNAGSSGTYNLTGGTLTSNSNEYVGQVGTGNFVQSGGTNIIQGSGKDLYLGNSNGGVGNYTLTNSAALNVGTNLIIGNSGTGAGTLTIQNTSSVSVANNLTINAHGTVNMSNGTLRIGNSLTATGVFNYTGGTIQLGGNRILNSDPAVVDLFGASPSITPFKTLAIEGQTDVDANVSVTGTLEGLSNTLPFRIAENAPTSATLSVSSGGNVTAGANVSIGSTSGGGAGTLLVTGGSTFTATGAMTIGPHGNGAMQITSGGAVSAFSALMGDQSNTSGNVFLSGTGSSWNLTTSLTVGNNGFGILTIGTGAQVYVGTQLNINNSSSTTINLNGGTLRFNTLNDPSNRLNFISGTLQLGGDRNFATDPVIDRFYGTSPTIVSGKNLTVEGAATIQPSSSLTLTGGTLTVGSLTDNGTFNFNAGALGITQPNASTVVTGTLNINLAGASITTPITTSNTSTINDNANNVSLGNFASFTGFNNQGVLNVGANTISLLSAGYAQLGSLTTLSGGTIFAVNGFYLSGGGNLIGSGSLNSRFTGSAGSVVEATGALALGDSTSPAGFNFDGELHTKQFAVTLNSSAAAGLGNLTTLGNGASSGTLNATNGFVVDFDNAVTGYGTINSTNTLAKHATINGTVQGTSVSQPISLSGYIKGTGTMTNVNFTGTYSPGLSPAIVTAGNLGFGSTSTLIMELGGTTPGSGYDQIQASGTLALGGTLNVSLINSFVPQLGQSFDILDWTTLGGSRSGTFSALQLPALSDGPLGWDTSHLYTTGVLTVTNTVPGDFNRDGHVDATDILPMEQALANPTAYQAAHNNLTTAQLLDIEDVNGDGKFNNADLQYLLITLKSGGGSADSVPEPASLVLLGLGALAIAFRRRSRWTVVK